MARYRLTKSENKILLKIKANYGDFQGQYDFWFIYDQSGNAISWEGGFDLGQHGQFRNQFTIEQGKQIKKNW